MSNLLEEELRTRVRQRGIDPIENPAELRVLAEEIVEEHDAKALRGLAEPLEGPHFAVASLTAAVGGIGPLQSFLEDPEIEEIWLNSPSQVFIAKHGKPELTTVILEERDVRDLVERMLLSSGRRLDLSTPFVDAALVGGERLHVVIPPITGRHWSLNIRKHVVRARRLTDLVSLGTLSAGLARFLAAAVETGLSILVSGATQAGKTTLVRALAGAIPASERIVTAEEVFELDLLHRDVVALQTRAATLEGTGEITLRALVKESLRMRPDRIIVGEVRGPEALDMLIALNAGIPGMSTIHANSAREALTKLTALPLLAGENVTSSFVVPTVATTIDLVVHLSRDAHGNRRISEVISVSGRLEGSVIEVSELYRDSALKGEKSEGFSVQHRFSTAGFDFAQLIKEIDEN